MSDTARAIALLLTLLLGGCIAYIPSTPGVGAEMAYQVCAPDPQAAKLEAVGYRHPSGSTNSTESSLSKTENGQRVLEGRMHFNAERLLVKVAAETPDRQPRVYAFRVSASMSSQWTSWATPLEMGDGDFPQAMKDYDAYRPLRRAELAKAPRMRWRTVELYTGRTYEPTPIPPC